MIKPMLIREGRIETSQIYLEQMKIFRKIIREKLILS